MPYALPLKTFYATAHDFAEKINAFSKDYPVFGFIMFLFRHWSIFLLEGMTLQFLFFSQNGKLLTKSNKTALQLILGICLRLALDVAFTEGYFILE